MEYNKAKILVLFSSEKVHTDTYINVCTVSFSSESQKLKNPNSEGQPVSCSNSSLVVVALLRVKFFSTKKRNKKFSTHQKHQLKSFQTFYMDLNIHKDTKCSKDHVAESIFNAFLLHIHRLTNKFFSSEKSSAEDSLAHQ